MGNKRVLKTKRSNVNLSPPDNEANAHTRKITVYVRRNQELALEEIQLFLSRETGRRPRKSELVQEAFDLLIEKYQPQLTAR